MVNKKTSRMIKTFTPKRANIASVGGIPLELPNHSRGKAPESDKGLANKEYIDSQFPVTHASTTGQTTDDHHVAFVKGDADLLYGDIALEHGVNDVNSSSATAAQGALADSALQTETFVAATHTAIGDSAPHHSVNAANTTYTSLVNDSMADALHRHSELSASDGTPNPALSVDATGQVGIGTTTPIVTSGLQIRNRTAVQGVVGTQSLFGNNVYYDEATHWYLIEAGGGSAVRMVDGNIQFHTIVSGAAGADISTEMDTTGRKMTILNNGNVGINKTAPGSKLAVVGLTDYANNAAAVTGGLTAGDFYTETSSNPKKVCVVY